MRNIVRYILNFVRGNTCTIVIGMKQFSDNSEYDISSLKVYDDKTGEEILGDSYILSGSYRSTLSSIKHLMFSFYGYKQVNLEGYYK